MVIFFLFLSVSLSLDLRLLLVRVANRDSKFRRLFFKVLEFKEPRLVVVGGSKIFAIKKNNTNRETTL